MAQQSIWQNLAQSPLVRGYQKTQQAKDWLGRQAVTGAALPIAAASDVLNKGVNAVNWGLGGDLDYLDTGATGRYLNFAQTGNFANPSRAALPRTVQPQQVAVQAPTNQVVSQQQPAEVDRTPIDWSKAVADAQRAVTGFGSGAINHWTPEQVEDNYQKGMAERLAKQEGVIRSNNARDAEYTRGERENKLLELTKQASALPPPTWAVANPGAPGAREALAGYNARMNEIQTQYDGLKQVLGYGQENRKQSMEEQKTAGDVQYKGALGRQADITSRKAEAEIPFIGQEAQARIGTFGAQNRLYGAQADAEKVKARAAMIKAVLEGQGGGSDGFGITGSDYVKQQLAAMKDLAQVNPDLYNQYMQMLQSMPKRGAMQRPNQEGY